MKNNLKFKIAEEMLENYNERLIKSHKRFLKSFDEAMEILQNNDVNLALELEENFLEYVDALKEEYYRANDLINEVVKKFWNSKKRSNSIII